MSSRTTSVTPGISPALPPAAVPSPCISLCEMAPDSGLCRGCLRTLDEIVQWGSAGYDYKNAVWADIRRREATLEFR